MLLKRPVHWYLYCHTVFFYTENQGLLPDLALITPKRFTSVATLPHQPTILTTNDQPTYPA